MIFAAHEAFTVWDGDGFLKVVGYERKMLCAMDLSTKSITTEMTTLDDHLYAPMT
jgi:hypothetical protein